MARVMEAVLYEGEIYCAKCVPPGTPRRDIHPVATGTGWHSTPVCCVCGMEHYVEEDLADDADESEDAVDEAVLPETSDPERE